MPQGVPIESDSEIELRRERVLSLRLRKMTEAAIAAVIGTSVATVSRDLAWIRQNWRERYGLTPTLDPAEIAGETLDLYRDIENLALLEHTRISDEARGRRISPMFAARQRMACLRTALLAREMQVSLMQDLGILDRALGTLKVVPRAAEIREAIRQARTEERSLVSTAEKRWREPRAVIDITPKSNGDEG